MKKSSGLPASLVLQVPVQKFITIVARSLAQKQLAVLLIQAAIATWKSGTWCLISTSVVKAKARTSPLLGELEQTAIDTGAGLERIAYLLQGKKNMYEIDEVYPVIQATERITGKTYGENDEDDILMRVVADHVRSSMMLIADGVRPGNDGRGYVLRRLIRRAVRSVRLLGYTDVAYPELLPVTKDAMKDSYPVLEAEFDRISQIAYNEEQAFRRTLTAGTQIFEQAAAEAKEAGIQLPGDAAFTLHDTYGFPIDLTLEMASEKGIAVDEAGFRQLMQEQRIVPAPMLRQRRQVTLMPLFTTKSRLSLAAILVSWATPITLLMARS